MSKSLRVLEDRLGSGTPVSRRKSRRIGSFYWTPGKQGWVVRFRPKKSGPSSIIGYTSTEKEAVDMAKRFSRSLKKQYKEEKSPWYKKVFSRDDNLDWRGNPDRLRVNIGEPWEINYWTKRFGISADRLVDIVNRVGPIVYKIEAALSRSPKRSKKPSGTRKVGRPKKSSDGRKSKTRTAAQKAATARMLAAREAQLAGKSRPRKKAGRPKKRTTEPRKVIFLPEPRPVLLLPPASRTPAQRAATAKMLAAKEARQRQVYKELGMGERARKGRVMEFVRRDPESVDKIFEIQLKRKIGGQWQTVNTAANKLSALKKVRELSKKLKNEGVFKEYMIRTVTSRGRDSEFVKSFTKAPSRRGAKYSAIMRDLGYRS